MKRWVLVAFVALVMAAYVVFYEITQSEGQGASSIGFANTVGLFSVVVGLVAALVLFGRATPVR